MTKKTGKKAKTELEIKEERIKVSKGICLNYSTGDYTIESCCGNEGITSRTFNNWRVEISEISDMYIKAQEEKEENYKKKLKLLAESALEKKLKGWEYEEVKSEGIRNKETNEIIEFKETVTTKTQIPDSAIIIFAITNRDPKNWVNKQNVDMTTKGESLHKKLNELPEDELRKLADGLDT